jgi:hypothetical protein
VREACQGGADDRREVADIDAAALARVGDAFGGEDAEGPAGGHRELLALGLRKVRREDGLPLHLVVVDERAFVDASLAPADQQPEPRERARRVAPAGTFRALLEGRAA